MSVFSFCFLIFSFSARADSSIYIEPYTHLYGDVTLIFDTVQITSERALLTEDSIRFWDNLRIEREDLTIYGGLGRYFFEKIYYINYWIRAEKEADTLVAKSGIFYEDREEVHARDSLILSSGNRRLKGDEGFYNFRERIGFIWGNVRFIDEKDTLELFSDTLKIYGDTLVIARNNRFIKQGFKAYSDSLLYYPQKDSLVLFGSPLVVTENDSLMGERIEMVIRDGKIARLWAEGYVRGKRWED